MSRIFLALCLAHLTRDFVFPAKWRGSAEGRSAALRFSAGFGVYLALFLAVIALFAPDALSGWRTHFYLVLAAAVLAALGHLREASDRSLFKRGTAILVVDELARLLVLALTASSVVAGPLSWISATGAAWERVRETALEVAVVYTAAIFAGGFLIRALLEREQADAAAGSKPTPEGELRAGMYIGWLERFVVITAILAKSPTTVGFIVAAKSLVRFKKVEASDEFAEYFLLGTFLSLTLAILAGLVLRWRIFGSLDLE